MIWVHLVLALLVQAPSWALSFLDEELEPSEANQQEAECDGCAELADTELQLLQLRTAINPDVSTPALAEVEQFRATEGVRLGKYTLVDKVMKSDMEPEPANTSWISMYSSLGARYRNESLLGRGEQAEVWQAFDVETQTTVAIKLPRYGKRSRYVTWETAGAGARFLLQLSSDECDMAQRVQRAAEGTLQDRAAASSILKCLGNWVFPRPGLQLPSHLVYEVGGPTLKEWLEARSHWTRASHGDLAEGRRIIAGMLLALRAMAAAVPPVIHHDLHPGNVMAFHRNGRFIVKVLDFGQAVDATKENMNIGIRGDWRRSPPECMEERFNPARNVTERQASPTKTFRWPAWSYDVHSLGVDYLQILCPGEDAYIRMFALLFEPYKPGLARRILDGPVWNDRGNLCVKIEDDEMALIESMLGPRKKRPSPSELLQHPLLANALEEYTPGHQ